MEEIIELEKEFFRYLADLTIEIIKMSSISEKELKKRVKFTNLDLVEAYFNKGESVIACTGHYGNWDLGMLALGASISQTAYVIYKPLNNPTFDNWFYKMRTRFGNECVPMRQTLRALAKAKSKPSMFCFASDQSPIQGESHYWIDFLNQPTAALLGLEKIAVQTNRPVFYFDLKRIKRGYYVVDCVQMFADPSKTVEHQITNQYFSVLTDTINDDPPYWLWSHRRWKYKRQYA